MMGGGAPSKIAAAVEIQRIWRGHRARYVCVCVFVCASVIAYICICMCMYAYICMQCQICFTGYIYYTDLGYVYLP